MIRSYLSTIYQYITFFISPPRCSYCLVDLVERKPLCSVCLMQITPIAPFDFYCTEKKVATVFALSGYHDPVRSLVISKYRRDETYVRFLAQLMAHHILVQRADFDLITFIPLHWTRYAVRGFNQAQIIADIIGQKTNKPVLPLVLRSKKTAYQASLSLHERHSNVADAFMINPQYAFAIAGKKIILVDDLFTTGATVKAVCLLMWKHKPEKIQIFVACRVVQ